MRVPWRHEGDPESLGQFGFETNALDLARSAGRNRVDNDEPTGNLEFGQASEQERTNLIRGRRRAILQHHGGGDIFAQRRVADAEGYRHADRGMLQQRFVHFAGRNFLARRG